MVKWRISQVIFWKAMLLQVVCCQKYLHTVFFCGFKLTVILCSSCESSVSIWLLLQLDWVVMCLQWDLDVQKSNPVAQQLQLRENRWRLLAKRNLPQVIFHTTSGIWMGVWLTTRRTKPILLMSAWQVMATTHVQLSQKPQMWYLSYQMKQNWRVCWFCFFYRFVHIHTERGVSMHLQGEFITLVTDAIQQVDIQHLLCFDIQNHVRLFACKRVSNSVDLLCALHESRKPVL